MLINFVDATNNANHYTKPPPLTQLLIYCGFVVQLVVWEMLWTKYSRLFTVSGVEDYMTMWQSDNGGWCVAVPVAVPAVELRIANTSLLVEWSVLPPERARGRITGYQVLLRQIHAGSPPAVEQPVIASVGNVVQHVIDGKAAMVSDTVKLKVYSNWAWFCSCAEQ